MKRIAYSFLLVALLSCGPSGFATNSNRVTIVFRNSVVKDYYLLSVRNNSLLIAPYSAGGILWTSLLPKTEAAPFEKIEKIVIKGDHSVGSVFLSGLAGCGILGFASSLNGCSCTGNGGGNTSINSHTLYYAGAGFLAGIVTGIFISTSDKEFDVANPANLKSLSTFYALYPNDEPPELRQIK